MHPTPEKNNYKNNRGLCLEIREQNNGKKKRNTVELGYQAHIRYLAHTAY